VIIFDAGIILLSKSTDFIGTRNIEVFISFLVYILVLLLFNLRFIYAIVIAPIVLVTWTWNLSYIDERLLLFFLFPPLISASLHDALLVLAVVATSINATYTTLALLSLYIWSSCLFLFFFLYIVNSMTREL